MYLNEIQIYNIGLKITNCTNLHTHTYIIFMTNQNYDFLYEKIIFFRYNVFI